MDRVTAASRLLRVVALTALAVVASACGSLELRPDEASAAEWKPVLRHCLEWSGDVVQVRIGRAGRHNFDQGEFPVIGSVMNQSSEAVTICIRRAVSDGSPVVGEWDCEPPIPIADGEPFVVPVCYRRFRLRADREWTPEEPMRVGDTASYDFEITSGEGTTTCRLRMVIARRWSDTFDEWWQPIVLVPLVPVFLIVDGCSYLVYGHGVFF